MPGAKATLLLFATENTHNMRKGLLSLILFLLATILSAQNIMKVWSNDTLIEFDISTIDSITFEVKTEYVGVFSVVYSYNIEAAARSLYA